MAITLHISSKDQEKILAEVRRLEKEWWRIMATYDQQTHRHAYRMPPFLIHVIQKHKVI